MARNSDNAAVKAAEERRAELQRSVEETQRRMDEARPTPTQEENDLAKIGALDIDAKESDGGQPEQSATRDVTAASSTASYNTRTAAKKD